MVDGSLIVLHSISAAPFPVSVLMVDYPACRDFSGRIRRAGFQGGAIAENIANGHRSAFDVVSGWMW